MPHNHNGQALEAALSFYSSIVTVSAEGDSLVSEDTLEGLGTTGFLLQALFGSLLKIANPAAAVTTNPSRPISTPPVLSTPEASESLQSLPGPGQEAIEAAQMAASAAPVRHAYGAVSAVPQQILADAVIKTAIISFEGAEPQDLHDFADLQQEDGEVVEIRLTDLLPEPGYFLAGAVSGGVSRTATAPLDRLKVYLLVNTKARPAEALIAAKHGQPLTALRDAGGPIVDALASLWRTGGFRTFFAGKSAVRACVIISAPSDC